MLAGNANAAYPDRPVHFIVGYAPGGGTDTLARIVAQLLSEKWGQPVLVENRPGDSGTIAADAVSHAAPDGYTLAVVSNAHTVTPSLHPLSYDPVASFAPVSEIAYVPDVLVVSSSSPARSVADLVALAKKEPGKLNFGTPGTGTSSYIETMLFMKLTDTKMVNVPFKSGSEVVTALTGGEIQLYFSALPTILGSVQAGTLRVLAVSSDVRTPLLPQAPTVAEALGIKDFAAANSDWTGILAPAGIPKDVLAKLNQAIVEVVNSPKGHERITAIGFVPVADSPEHFTESLKTQIPQWGNLLKSLDATK